MTNLFKNIFGTPFKHKKLSEDWANLQSSVNDGVTFTCRELGSTVVTEAQNEVATAEAIRRVIHLVRATHAKTKRVTLHVSSKGVKVRCSESGLIVRDTTIYDIAYCSADSQYNHVIAFISNGERNVFDCYAYLCQSSKMAQTVALAIAHAFNMAYNETWQAEFEESQRITEDSKSDVFKNNLIEIEPTNDCSDNGTKNTQVTIDLGKKLANAESKLSFNHLNKHFDDHITEEDKKKRRSNFSQSDSATNWTSFDDDCRSFVVNSLSSLKLDDDEKRSPLTSTKPPQRCKESANLSAVSNNTPIITWGKTKALETLVDETKVAGSKSYQRSVSDVRLPTSDNFGEFESLWKSKSENFNWETFGNSSPSGSFSSDFCQSPVAVKPSGTVEWTNFND